MGLAVTRQLSRRKARTQVKQTPTLPERGRYALYLTAFCLMYDYLTGSVVYS